MTATIFMSPPHFGHTSGSTVQTFAFNFAQAYFCSLEFYFFGRAV